MDCPHSTPDAWQEGRNPNCPILRAGDAWKARRFAGNPGTRRTGGCAGGALPGARFLWSLTHGFGATWQQPIATFKTIVCTCGPNRCGNDGYYEVHKHVCIDSRSSRLLWGSGNARRNRMDVERGAGTGFPNRDDTNVGVLENWPIGRWEQSESPTASTGGDARCAMPL